MLVPLKLDITTGDKITPREIDYNLLKKALNTTSIKRGSIEVLKNYKKIIENIKNSKVLNEMWENYRKDYNYAKEVNFYDTCDLILKLLEKLK